MPVFKHSFNCIPSFTSLNKRKHLKVILFTINDFTFIIPEVCQNCFSLLRAATEKGGQLSAISGVTLVAGVVALSLFRYAWYDPAALLCFFIATALIAADARYHRARVAVPSDKMTEDENAVEMEYYGKA